MKMSKRSFRALALTGLLLVLALGVFSSHAQEQSVVNLYSSGDTNITDWLQNTIIPAFEAQYPQYKVQFTNSRAAGDDPIVERAMAAKETRSEERRVGKEHRSSEARS